MRRKLRIGELLVENGLLTAEQLTLALQAQKKRGMRLGQILVDLGYVEENQLLDFLARQLDIPFVNLSKVNLSQPTVMRLPEQHARRFNAIVIGETEKDLEVGLADPTDLLALDELSRILKRPSWGRRFSEMSRLDISFMRSTRAEAMRVSFMVCSWSTPSIR